MAEVCCHFGSKAQSAHTLPLRITRPYATFLLRALLATFPVTPRAFLTARFLQRPAANQYCLFSYGCLDLALFTIVMHIAVPVLVQGHSRDEKRAVVIHRF